MANITIKDLKEKLSEYSDDMVISEECIDNIHKAINLDGIENKYVHVHCDYYVPMNYIIGNYKGEFKEHAQEYSDAQEAVEDWIYNDPCYIEEYEGRDMTYTLVDSIPE